MKPYFLKIVKIASEKINSFLALMKECWIWFFFFNAISNERKERAPLTFDRLWLSDQEGSIVVIWLHEQRYCFVPADPCVKPPERGRKIQTLRQCCHADTESSKKKKKKKIYVVWQVGKIH